MAFTQQRRAFRALVGAVALAALALAPAAQAADIPPLPQGYPIANLYSTCTEASAHAEGCLLYTSDAADE